MKTRQYSWQDGKSLRLEVGHTLIMGILNGTPDSFSDGGLYNQADQAVQHALDMIDEGADIIDLGVESTRPGHVQISVEEEIARMKDLLPAILEAVTVPVSIDAYRAKSMDYALSAGAHIINDIWGLQYDPDMVAVAAYYQVPVIIMHNQVGTDYDDIISDMKAFYAKSIDLALKEGVKLDNIWIDPGIGFGKTAQQNMEVLQRLDELTSYDALPLLLATSRKGFIGKLLGDLPPRERDEGTLATTMAGVYAGAHMVRVHNVRMHKRALTVLDAILRGE